MPKAFRACNPGGYSLNGGPRTARVDDGTDEAAVPRSTMHDGVELLAMRMFAPPTAMLAFAGRRVASSSRRSRSGTTG
jgi:hypothetical protein